MPINIDEAFTIKAAHPAAAAESASARGVG